MGFANGGDLGNAPTAKSQATAASSARFKGNAPPNSLFEAIKHRHQFSFGL